MPVICHICAGSFSGVGPGLDWGHDTEECARVTPQRYREALRDCIPFLAVSMDKHRRDFGLDALHPTHAELLDRVSVLAGGEAISQRLK